MSFMDTLFEAFSILGEVEDRITGETKRKKDEREAYLNSLTPRQRWIEETMEFQRQTKTCRYTFIPREDGDYDIIDNGC
jgi:hypothetical protein